MPRKRKTLHVLTLFVAGALAADTLGGCVGEGDPGPSLNPQPLPPTAPPDEQHGETTEPPASHDDKEDDGTSPGGVGASSSGSAGSSGNPTPIPDAGGN